MVVDFTFFGGAGDYEKGELGGVQLFVHDKGLETKLLIDAGQRPDHTNQYFDFRGRPKPFNYVELSNLLELYYAGLPNAQSLWRHDYMRKRHLVQGPCEFDGLLITHPHYDHIGGLTGIRDDLLTFVPQEAMPIMWVWQYTSGRTMNQFIDLYEHYTLVPSTSGGLRWVNAEFIGRNIQTFTHEQPFMIGNMKITPYRVDHSTPGCYGFVLHTSAGNIAISGDLRMRGRFPGRTHHYIDELAKMDLKAFFIEGSLLHFPHKGTESDVSQAVSDLMKGRAFVTTAFPPRDFDRLRSLYDAAKANDRMLVVNPAMALGLKLYNGMDGYPKLNMKYIGVLVKPQGKGIVDDPEYPLELVESDYTWQKPFLKYRTWSPPEGDSGGHLSKPQRVSLEEMKRHQDSFFVYLGPGDVADVLPVVKPRKGSRHVSSVSTPWTLEMEIQQQRFINLLEAENMYEGPQPDVLNPEVHDSGSGYMPLPLRKVWTAHVTGHFNRPEVRGVVKKVATPTLLRAPPTIVPYHNMSPQYFINDVAKGAQLIIPERGKTFTIT